MNKYEKRFVRMMIKMFALIVGLFIIMILVKIPTKISLITFGIMLILAYLVKTNYWNYLEGLELKEKMDVAIKG